MAFMVLSLSPRSSRPSICAASAHCSPSVRLPNHKLNWAALASTAAGRRRALHAVSIAFGLVTLRRGSTCGLGLVLVPLVVMELAKAVGLVKKRHGKKQ